jgi:L-histidine N-alpha-methyltransferase
MDTTDVLLLGTDLVKEPARLVAAYDDAEGVTADFNRNVLRVVDRALDADFDPDRFDHVAVWNARRSWIEMRLRSQLPQTVVVRALDLKINFDPGEDILTEISAKFEPRRLRREFVQAGLSPIESCTDRAGDFMLSLTRPS